MAFSPDGKRAVSGSRGGTMRLWELEKGFEMRRLKSNTPAVIYVAFTPDGRHVLAGNRDNTVQKWDLTK